MDGPKPVVVDSNGDPWWNYLYEYDWEGKTYGFDICARSQDEANARLKRLPLARYVGQGHGGPIPLHRGGFLVRLFVWLFVWWKNLTASR